MKKILVILMAMGLFSAMPVLAADHTGMKMDSHEGMTMQTSEGVRECALQAETIQQKIKRIQTEINSGSKKYSANDLKKLEDKLKETNELLKTMGSNP
jgi:septal ring factor EnvC (AmiA/AmiB activator)